MKRILSKKIPLYFFLIAGGLLCLIIYHLENTADEARQEMQAVASAQSQQQQAVQLTQMRLQEYELTKPLLMTESNAESKNLKELKRDLNFEINQLRQNGTINDASVYVGRLNDDEWTSVNNNSEYSPGSIIKVAAMITYLKMSEANPALLNKEFLFRGRRKGVPQQTFNDDPMVPGKKYSAKELLSRVIVNSDNDATLFINESLDIAVFKRVFTDLGIDEPDVHDPKYKISVTDVSKFMRVLYNATYLNKENSEYALSLLSRTSFTKGIVSGLPSDVKVAHKFGETGNPAEAQLHETAIVYINNNPYLITIMTRGKNVQLLPGALGELSKIAYQKMKSAS